MKYSPVTVHCMKIGMADARIFDIHKDLIWAGCRNIDFLVLDRSTDLLDYLSPLFLWDVWSHTLRALFLKCGDGDRTGENTVFRKDLCGDGFEVKVKKLT